MYFLKAYRRGVFNRYRKGMPWPEMMVKDLKVVLFNLKAALTFQSPKTILCFPHFPSSGSTIARIAKHRGWQITNKMSRKYDVAMFWEYGTVRKEDAPLRALNRQVVNLNSLNISKDYVDDKMMEAFGYATKINPSQFTGIAVKKSNTNALHDGHQIDCPTEREEGFIYQKLIDSSVNEGEVMDMRVVIMNLTIPHIYLNYRNKGERFKNVPDRSELCTAIGDVLSKDEQDQIIRFCGLIGLEYGELDVLRDCNDKRIYVVDANNTPQGPPKPLTPEKKRTSVQLLADAFESTFLN